MLVVIMSTGCTNCAAPDIGRKLQGRIVKSDVMASHQQRIDEATEVVDLPAIEYEFSANGRNYIGRRISVGEDSGGANMGDAGALSGRCCCSGLLRSGRSETAFSNAAFQAFRCRVAAQR